MFDHEGPTVVRAMHDRTVGVFDNLDITSLMCEDKRVAYLQSILIEYAIKKYKAVLVECNQLEKDLAVDSWNLGKLKELSIDNFLTWANKYGICYEGDAYLGQEKCVEFKKEL